MEWLDSLVGLVGGAASGGIFGLLSAGVGAVAKHFQLKAEREFKKAEWAHEERLFEKQMEFDKQRHNQEVEIVAQEGSWQNMSTALEHDTSLSRVSSEWVNNVKSLVRPILTLFLNVIQFVIFWQVWTAFVSGESNAVMSLLNAPASPATDLLRYVVYSIVFAAQTCNLFWFGERAFAPPGMKNR